MNRDAPDRRDRRIAGRRASVLVAVAAGAGLVLWRSAPGVALGHAGMRDDTRAVLDANGAVVTVFAGLRVVLLVVCVALAALGALHALAATSGARPLEVLAGALTPRVLRPFLGVVTMASLAAPVGMAGASDAPPVMVLVTTTTGAPSGPPPTMRRVDPLPPSPPSTTAVPASDSFDVAVVSPVAPKSRPGTPSASSIPAPVDTPATWTIARGEHLWSVAADVVGRALGRPGSEDEVAPYWRVLVDANRDRLVDPDNSDLVFAGQELTLPRLPGR